MLAKLLEARKRYSKYCTKCYFCLKNKSTLLIHLREKHDTEYGQLYTIVQICYRCRDIVDSTHEMKVENILKEKS